MRGLLEGWLVGGLGGAVLAGVFSWLGAGSPLAHAGTPEAAEAAVPLEIIDTNQFLPAVPATAVSALTAANPEPRRAAVRRSEVVAPGRKAAPVGPQAVTDLPACDSDLRLVGSVVNEAAPRLSLAMLGKSGGSGVVAVGGRIDRFTLVSVEPLRATLQGASGNLCTVAIFTGKKSSGPAVATRPPPRPARPSKSATPAKKSKGKPMFSQEELKRGVRLLSSGSYMIERELFMRALSNPGGAAGGAYFMPFREKGATTGMTVHRVRNGSTLAAMGIETGDVVRSVNGHGLDTAANLLGALRSARESDSVTLTVVRDGHERPVHYLIQ